MSNDRSLFEEKLAHRASQGLTRQRRCYTIAPARHFSHNDYLGLSNAPALKEAFAEGAFRYGFGGRASPLVSGYSYPHEAFEAAFAEYRGHERALLLGSGYLANLACIQGLADEKTALFYDKANHASLYDGATLSHATLHRYRSLSSLKDQLQTSESSLKVVVSESFFSTDGRRANLPELLTVSTENNALAIVDDAHGFGLFPLRELSIPLIVTPLGKAMGGYGGVISGSSILIETILQHARTYLFSTAPPPAMAHALQAGLNLVQSETWRAEKLFENITFF